MNRICFISLMSVTTVCVSACATASLPINGQSTAGHRLQSDAVRILATNFSVAHNCNVIDSIDVSQIRVNPPGTGDSVASREFGSVEERWTIHGCAKHAPYLVTFTPDGKGGAYFRTVEEK